MIILLVLSDKIEMSEIVVKKERVIAAIEGKTADHVPTGFSLHFPKGCESDLPGIEAHLSYFKQTDTDIIKVMNENLVPDIGAIRTPNDWRSIPTFSVKDRFIAKQLDMAKAILDKSAGDAFAIGTIHGICASAIHPIEARYGYTAVRELLCAHLRENRAPVVEAFQRITDIMCQLAVRYAEIGFDGIYYAALGAEKHFFTDAEFEDYIAPFDKQILSAAKQAGAYNILHICKENLNMERYIHYATLADVVNWGVYETNFGIEEGQKLFPGVAIMGGFANRSGVLIDGTAQEIKDRTKQLIQLYGKQGFILGADCTLPTEIPYSRIKTVVEAAREI